MSDKHDENWQRKPLHEPALVRYRIHSLLDRDTGEIVPWDPNRFKISEVQELREIEQRMRNYFLNKGRVRPPVEHKPGESRLEQLLRSRKVDGLAGDLFAKAKGEGEDGEG